jgi:hypothetical protein
MSLLTSCFFSTFAISERIFQKKISLYLEKYIPNFFSMAKKILENAFEKLFMGKKGRLRV